jgi:hypothetical protein
MGEKQQMVIVPEIWLKSLMENALDFEKSSEKWEYGKSAINDGVHFKAVALSGYAKSAKFALEHNKRIEI